MLKKIDDYIQQKINKSLQEKENVLEKTGRFFLPETDRGELLARSDGVQQVAVVGDHLVQPAGGHGVQHTEPAVIGVGVL